MNSHTKGKTEFTTTLLIGGIAILMVIIWIVKPRIQKPKEQTPLVACRVNLKQLGLGLQIYADENSGTYPLPEKWCDLITPSLGNLADKVFRCPAIKDNKCHYAINPNCKLNSPPDTVLLFETKSGDWNSFGGPELLTTDNHKEKICNVLFNDGTVKRIRKEDIPNLRWNAEYKEE